MVNEELLAKCLLTVKEIFNALREANMSYKSSKEHYLVLNSDIELRALFRVYLIRAIPIIRKAIEEERLDRPKLREKIAKKDR